MRRETSCFGIANNFSIEQIRSQKLLLLVLSLSLAALNIACSTVQAGNPPSSQSKASIAISVPAQSAKVGVAYNVVPTVSGGTAPYTFALLNGSLPPGFSLNARTGSLTGTPTVAGEYTFTLMVADPHQDEGTIPVRIMVAAANSDNQQRTVVTISPSNATIVSQAVQQFTASVTGTSNTAVSWTA